MSDLLPKADPQEEATEEEIEGVEDEAEEG